MKVLCTPNSQKCGIVRVKKYICVFQQGLHHLQRKQQTIFDYDILGEFLHGYKIDVNYFNVR